MYNSDSNLPFHPPHQYYCFWDAKPFNVTADGTKVDIPEADYPVDSEGKYESAYDQPFGYCGTIQNLKIRFSPN